MTDPSPERPKLGRAFDLLDKVDEFISTMTGVKAKFVAAGWSERGAEEMTHALFLSAKRPPR